MIQENINENVEDEEADLYDLIKQVQSHTVHKRCMRKDKKTGEEKCRFDFPKPLEPETIIRYEKHSVSDSGQYFYRVKLETKRNDPSVNKHIPVFLQNWRGNLDFQVVLDPVTCAEYIVKYT